VRIGEALGLRHEDLDIAGRVLTVRPRSNDNRARAKAGVCRTVSSDDNRDHNCSPTTVAADPFWAPRAWSRVSPGLGSVGIGVRVALAAVT
jgi:hypothetical protein